MNPFAALGLPARPGLTDDQVRAAWRAVAAATHPDRDDGGDPAAYSAAAAAYAQLRTALGTIGSPRGPGRRPVRAARRAGSRRTRHRAWQAIAVLPAQGQARPAAAAGRPRRSSPPPSRCSRSPLIPGNPAAPAVAAGAFLWLAFTARGDLAPPPGR